MSERFFQFGVGADARPQRGMAHTLQPLDILAHPIRGTERRLEHRGRLEHRDRLVLQTVTAPGTRVAARGNNSKNLSPLLDPD